MTELKELTRPQLVALAAQRTNLTYRNILAMDDHKLVAKLATVENVLVPVNASEE